MAIRRQRPGVRLGRLVTATLAVVVASCLAAPAAGADDGVLESSENRFVVNSRDRRVDVAVAVTLSNPRSDPTTSGEGSGVDWHQVQVPRTATHLSATSAGQALRVSLEPDNDYYSYATVRFPRLRQGRTRTITYRYRVPAAPVRSGEPTRVGDGYAAFEVLGSGDAGRIGVEVVIPAGMQFTSATEGFTSQRDGDTVTWRARAKSAETSVWSFVSARDATRVAEHRITVAGDPVTVLSFTGDDDWAEFVSDQLIAGVPLLAEQVGVPWPGGVSRIREDVAPAVTGYAWFDPQKKEIVIGEGFDTPLLLHEASHAWLDADRFSGRWLYEGLADVVAYRVAERIGDKQQPPSSPARGGREAIPLTHWQEGIRRVVDDAERYGYDASFTAMQQLLGPLHGERFTEVVRAAYDGESAYEPPGRRPLHPTPTDWRRFLDLVEDRGGNSDASRIYRTWVLDEKQQSQLAQRETQRAAYRALDAADAGWRPPQGLRILMTQWQFAAAGEVMDSLAGVAAAAGRLQRTALAAGVPYPAGLRQTYQDAATNAEYEALGDQVSRATAAVEQVADATLAAAAAADPFTELVELLVGVDATAQAARDRLGAGELDAAADLAAAVAAQLAWTRWVDVAASAAGLLVLAGIGTLLRLRRGSAQVRTSQLDQPDVTADGLGAQPQVILTGLGTSRPDEAGGQRAGEGGDVGPHRDARGDPDGQRP